MPSRDLITQTARSWLGTPYHHQASLKGVGTDCLGLLRGVYREVMGCEDPEQIPAYNPSWYEISDRDPLLHAGRRHLIEKEVKFRLPGDALVFKMKETASAKHCGILTGPDTMIHAYNKGSVVEVNLGDWWVKRIAGVFEFPGVTD